MQTDQLGPLFHTFSDLVNRVVAWQTIFSYWIQWGGCAYNLVCTFRFTDSHSDSDNLMGRCTYFSLEVGIHDFHFFIPRGKKRVRQMKKTRSVKIEFFKNIWLAVMTILASETLLHENKNPATKCYPSKYWTWDLRLSGLMLSSLSHPGMWDVFKLSFVHAPLQSYLISKVTHASIAQRGEHEIQMAAVPGWEFLLSN